MQSQQWIKNRKMGKIPAWQLTNLRNKSEVIADAREKGHTVHFALSMDFSHLKNSELEPQYQKYKVESLSEVTL